MIAFHSKATALAEKLVNCEANLQTAREQLELWRADENAALANGDDKALDNARQQIDSWQKTVADLENSQDSTCSRCCGRWTDRREAATAA